MHARCTQIIVQRTRAWIIDHIDRPSHGIRGNRESARHGLEQHEAECVGLAGEHKNIGGGIHLREFVLIENAEIVHFRKASSKSIERGADSGYPLRSGQIQFKERLDILLDRNAADVEKDWRFALECIAFLRMEYSVIHSP